VSQDGQTHQDLHYRFGRLLTVTNRAWEVYLDKRLAPLGLTGPRWHLLVELANLPSSPSQRELAELLNIEPASLIKQLDALALAGLVRRIPHETDRRTKMVEITNAGRKVMERISATARDVRREILEGVSEQEVEVTMSLFRKMGKNLENL